MGQVQASLGVSERRACQVLGQHRSTQRKAPHRPDDEAALTADVIELATTYGRYGYRRIAALLRGAGWAVNIKRVERIWRQEGLKVPARLANPSLAAAQKSKLTFKLDHPMGAGHTREAARYYNTRQKRYTKIISFC